MVSVKNFFNEFDLKRAFILSFFFHTILLINFLDIFHFRKTIKPPPELQITFQKLENRVVQNTTPIPKEKPIEKKIVPILKKDALIPSPEKKIDIKPEEKKEEAPTKANSDIRNAGEVALNDYSNLLAKHIARFKQYPRMAQMRGWQGEIVLQVELNGDGALISSKIVKASGFEVLDNEGLDMVKRASPFPVPPEILHGKSFSILVPIKFKLE